HREITDEYGRHEFPEVGDGGVRGLVSRHHRPAELQRLAHHLARVLVVFDEKDVNAGEIRPCRLRRRIRRRARFLSSLALGFHHDDLYTPPFNERAIRKSTHERRNGKAEAGHVGKSFPKVLKVLSPHFAWRHHRRGYIGTSA